MEFGNAREAMADLLAYRTDVAIFAWTVDDDRLHSVPWWTSPLIAFVARDHPWARRGEISLRALVGQRLVLRERRSQTRDALEAALSDAALTVDSRLEVEGAEAVREAVAAGLGVGVMTGAEFGSDERLAPLALAGCDAALDERVVCLRERRRLPVVRAFFKVALARARGSEGG